MASLVAQTVKCLPTMWETWVQSLGQEDPLEKEMGTRSSTLTWKIPWTEEPGRLQSMESQSRTRLNDFTFTFHFSLSYIGEGKGNPLQCSCLENPRDGGAWWAAVHGVAESWTRLSDFTFTFMHWRRKWQPTPMFLPGESQGLRSLVGCRVWGRTELDTTEVT